MLVEKGVENKIVLTKVEEMPSACRKFGVERGLHRRKCFF